MSRGLARKCPNPLNFEVRLRRPGPGVVAFLQVSLLGREIQGSPLALVSSNQVEQFLEG